jgi:hypothetical protein
MNTKHGCDPSQPLIDLTGARMRQLNRDLASPQRLLLSIALIIIGAVTASGCDGDAEVQGVIRQDCENDTDCPSGSRCTLTSKGQRLCLTPEALNPSDISEADVEAFDPTGRVVCGKVIDALFCLEGQVCCNDVCVDAQEDESNCGGCGVSCDLNEECSLGECQCGAQSCVDSETCCVEDGGLPQCRPLLDDRENCGGCGNVCNAAAREYCLDGQCGCIKEVTSALGPRQLLELCREGQSCCPPPASDPTALLGCVDLNTVDNCGACGNQCGAGEQCVDGQCTCGTVPHPSRDGLGPVCDTTDTDPGADVLPREACCFNPNGRQECRPFADCDCGGVQCTGLQICCLNEGFGRDSCIDPTQDMNNCGGCASDGSGGLNPEFLCQPGEVCQRNFNYSVSRSPEEQNANGIYIGECKINCAQSRVACPGGIDPDTSLPYTQDAQSCIDPLSSNEFCGAILKVGATSTTSGRCSESEPQTYGQLRNFQGVRCAQSERCEAKVFCDNPDPPPGTDNSGAPCAPRTHYYYDVSEDTQIFPDPEAIPQGGVFFIDGSSSQADRDAYLENPFLKAVCVPL